MTFNTDGKKITAVLKLSTDIITSITARPIRIAAVLAIMSVSTFKTAIILYVIAKAILSVFDRETTSAVTIKVSIY